MRTTKKPCLDWQNNNCADASCFFVLFLCRHCTTTCFMFCGGREQGNDFLFLFLNFNIQPFRIQLQKKLPTFDNYWMRWDKRDKVWSSSTSLLSDIFVAVAVVVAQVPCYISLKPSLRSMAVLSSQAQERQSHEKNKKLLPAQSPRDFSALARLYYLACPTKTGMLRRLTEAQQRIYTAVLEAWYKNNVII